MKKNSDGFGRIGIILMPRVESDVSVVTATLPYGSPASKVDQVSKQLAAAAEQTARDNGGDKLVEGIFSLIDENVVEVVIYLTDPDMRPISTTELTQSWRQNVGTIPGLESLRFEADRGGPGRGAALTIEWRIVIVEGDTTEAPMVSGLGEPRQFTWGG